MLGDSNIIITIVKHFHTISYKDGEMKKILVFLLLFSWGLLFGAVLDTEATLGSRKNPLPLKISSIIQIEEAMVEVNVVEVARGNHADLFLRAFGSYVEPMQTKEHLLFSTSMKYLKDKTENDKPLTVGESLFDIATSDYNKRHLPQSVIIESTLDGILYENGSHTGLLIYDVDPDREYYLVINDVWFELGDDSSQGMKTMIAEMF